MEDLSLPTYWDHVYSSHDPTWDDIYSFVHKVDTNPNSRILIVGCGRSKLGFELYNHGFHDVINLDFNERVITDMQDVYDEVQWIHGDARDMSMLDDLKFDIVIDNCFLDVLALYPNPGSALTSYLEEVKRVLDHDGSFVVVSRESKDWLLTTMELAEDSRFYVDEDVSTFEVDLPTEENEDPVSESFTVGFAYLASHPVKRKLRQFFYGKLMPVDKSDQRQRAASGKPGLLDADHWNDLLSELGFHCTDASADNAISPPSKPGAVLNPENTCHHQAELDHQGFTVLPCQDNWPEDVSFDKIISAINLLKSKGWPPIFLFMYDEAWQWMYSLFEQFQGFYHQDMGLEASVYVWALDRQPEVDQTGKLKQAGGVSSNFSLPHRDLSFTDCHFPNGDPNLLTVWVPIVETTVDNGCIYILPRQHDELFAQQDHRRHMCAGVNKLKSKSNIVKPNPAAVSSSIQLFFPHHLARPVLAKPGAPIVWHANAIHWGSSCASTAKQPRISIALAFHHPDSLANEEERESHRSICGRLPLKRDEVLQLSVMERLKLVAKSMIMYSHWFPDFENMDFETLGVSNNQSGRD